MKNYIFTDLAYELEIGDDGINDLLWKEERLEHNIWIIRCRMDTEKEQGAKRKKGDCVTVFSDPIWSLGEEAFQSLRRCLSDELRRMIKHLTGVERMNESVSVLVIGLGNAQVTADSLGPVTVEKIKVTRHLFDLYGMLADTPTCAVSAFVPGVLGNTGIESVELIRGAVEAVQPDLVIAVDALAAKSHERIAATVQLSEGGILPGSGIGNLRKAVSYETLGVPVLALGVPTVINSATLIAEALRQGGIFEVPKEMRSLLENGKNFFVTPKESDWIVKSVSHLLAAAIDGACTSEE